MGAGVFDGASISEAQALEGEDVYVLEGATPPARPPRTSPGTRGASPFWCVARPSAASMSHYLIHQMEMAPNIDVRFGCEIVDGGGEGRLAELVLRERGVDALTHAPSAAGSSS